MSPHRLPVPFVVFAVVLITSLASLAIALATGLPTSIDAYQNWTRLNTDRVTTNPTGAHPPSKDVYVNLDIDTLLDDGALVLPFPDGTVLVKERNDVSRLLVDRIYTMEKMGSRWEYGIFDRQPDGDFSATLLGSDNFCHSCHTRAEETDFVFTPFERR